VTVHVLTTSTSAFEASEPVAIPAASRRARIAAVSCWLRRHPRVK
jgi:hypothetical protein